MDEVVLSVSAVDSSRWITGYMLSFAPNRSGWITDILLSAEDSGWNLDTYQLMSDILKLSEYKTREVLNECCLFKSDLVFVNFFLHRFGILRTKFACLQSDLKHIESKVIYKPVITTGHPKALP